MTVTMAEVQGLRGRATMKQSSARQSAGRIRSESLRSPRAILFSLTVKSLQNDYSAVVLRCASS